MCAKTWGGDSSVGPKWHVRHFHQNCADWQRKVKKIAWLIVGSTVMKYHHLHHDKPIIIKEYHRYWGRLRSESCRFLRHGRRQRIQKHLSCAGAWNVLAISTFNGHNGCRQAPQNCLRDVMKNNGLRAVGLRVAEGVPPTRFRTISRLDSIVLGRKHTWYNERDTVHCRLE